MTYEVKEIVKEWLEENGFDGLWYTNCGCFTGDLMPCSSFSGHCQGGYTVKVGNEKEIHPDKPEQG